jgi:hypothetical protein
MTFYRSTLVSALILFLLSVLPACKEGKNPQETPPADSTARVATDSRGQLILALEEVRRLVATKDSQQIASMFRFPIPDSVLSLSGDSVFEVGKARDGGNVSQALFLSGYGKFAQELQFGLFEDALRDVDFGKLRSTDSLGSADTSKNKACISGYAIQIRKDSVVAVEVYENRNTGYTGHGNEDPECEEYLLSWEFVFDGKRLYMTFHSEAD